MELSDILRFLDSFLNKKDMALKVSEYIHIFPLLSYDVTRENGSDCYSLSILHYRMNHYRLKI